MKPIPQIRDELALARLKELTSYMDDKARLKLIEENRSETYTTYQLAFDAAIAELSRRGPEFDERAMNAFARTKAPNAYRSLNEVDSDVDYFHDLAKAEGIREGARFQFNQLSPALAAVAEHLLKLVDVSNKLVVFEKECARLTEKLAKAVQFLKEGKAKFTPNTTNSFVDDFIKDCEALSGREEGGV